MRSFAQIKEIAKPSFKAYLGSCALVIVLYVIVSVVSSVAALFVVPLLTVGMSFTFLQVYTGQAPSAGSLFSGFEKYGRNLGAMLITGVFTFLWSLLLIVPGIIKAFSYSMTPYILADSYDIRARDAVNLSKRITKGYKARLFLFRLSYIGWALLCSSPSLLAALTGIIMPNMVVSSVFAMVGVLCSMLLMLFVFWPYYMTGSAGFYLELKKEAIESQTASQEEFR